VITENRKSTAPTGGREASPQTSRDAQNASERKSLRIFLSSPGDVAEERALAEIVFRRLADEFSDAARFELVIWEHEPLFGHTGFQQQIDRPSQCDLVVSILWSRLGTRLPADFAAAPGKPPPTGTEFEILDAIDSYHRKKKPVLLIYRKVPAPHVGLSSPEFAERTRQYQMLDAFCLRTFYDADGAVTVAHHSFTDSHEFERRLAEHLRRWLEDEIQSHDSGAAGRQRWRGGSPFRGLQTFEAEHQAIFFGRAESLSSLIQRIRQVEATSPSERQLRLLIVQGMSGSGKTSLINAGLLPLLEHRPIEGIAHWLSASFRPSESSTAAPEAGPLGVLATRIAEKLPSFRRLEVSIAQLATALHDNPREAAARIEMALASQAARPDAALHRARLIIYIDQLEEALTLNEVLPHAEALFAAITELSRAPHIWVLATLRSDFAHRLEAYPDLMKALGQSPAYTLLPPRADELAEMIREPALAAGLLWETREGISLDQELLRDCAGNPEALPLLEYTLQQLYERRDGRLLPWSAYEGGLRGALIAAAEEVVNGTGEDAEVEFRTVMRELVGVGEDGAATRRYAPLTRFVAGSAGRLLLERMITRRLCVTTDLGRGEGPVTALAHEALIRSWPRVQSWLQTETALLRVRDELVRDAVVWERHARSDDWLGVAPEKLASIRQVEGAGLLSAGVAADYAHRSRRRAERNRWLKRAAVTGICALTVVSVIAGLFAVKQRNVAVAAQTSAEREARTARATTDFLVRLFREVDPGQARGDELLAREVMDRGLERARVVLAREPEVLVPLLIAVGEVYGNLGLQPKAEAVLREALQIARSTGGALAPQIPNAEAALAGALLDIRTRSESERLMQSAIATLKNDPARELEGMQVEARYGYALWRWGENNRARTMLAALEERAKARVGAESELRAQILLDLGRATRDAGDLAKGLEYLKEGAQLNAKLFGENYLWYGDAVSDIGYTYWHLSRYEEAIRNLAKSRVIFEKVLGPEHSWVAVSLYGEGGALADSNRPALAIDRLTRSVAIFEKNGELGDNDGINALQVLGRAYGAREDWANAVATFDRAEALASKSYVAGSRLNAGLMTGHAFYIYRSGQIERAVQMLRQVEAIQAASSDTNPRSLQAARQALADVLCARGPNTEGFALAIGLRDNPPIDTPAWSKAIVSGIIAKCDPEPANRAANELAIKAALATIVEARGKGSVVTRDMVRRLATFYDSHGDSRNARATREALETDYALSTLDGVQFQ